MKYSFKILILITLCCSSWYSRAQSYPDPEKHPCLKCHSNQTYSFFNTVTKKEEKRLMNPYYILDTIALRNGVHNQFDCTDCHSYDYTTYPHNANLKLEPMNTCLDCHGGDEAFAQYKFEEIEKEFHKSIHYQVYGDNFTCSKCHSQHTYANPARRSDDILKIVDADNKMCLSCHNDMKRYELVAGHKNPELVQVHNWLPNQELHFSHVRCIECHTDQTSDLLVAHNILSKDKAVRNCVECHSANSRLKATLYKYENLRTRAENGGIKAVLINQPFIIGTNQNHLLKLLSIIIFLASLAGIITHTIFRILKK